MQPALETLLEKKRNRCLGIVMTVKEREVDRHLSDQTSAKLRKVILDQFNDYHAMVLDIMASLDTGDVTLNEHWLQKLDEIHEALVRRDEIVFKPRRLTPNGAPTG